MESSTRSFFFGLVQICTHYIEMESSTLKSNQALNTILEVILDHEGLSL
jgi:hypothetical protein